MTAIKKYQRLEAKGFWFNGTESNPKEVIISFGKASIIISDQNEIPLDHWNFNSIVILERNKSQIIVSPGVERAEKLIIKDEEMINAINIICEYENEPKVNKLKSTHSIKLLILCVITAFFFYTPSLVRNLLLDIIKPSYETILVNNFLEDKNLLRKSCKKQPSTVKFEEKISEIFGIETGIDISINKSSLSSPLLLPGGKIIFPFNWFNQKDSKKKFIKLLNLALINFEERKVFIKFLKEQDLFTLVGFILGFKVSFNLTPEHYYAKGYERLEHSKFDSILKDEIWVNIKNSCLN